MPRRGRGGSRVSKSRRSSSRSSSVLPRAQTQEHLEYYAQRENNSAGDAGGVHTDPGFGTGFGGVESYDAATPANTAYQPTASAPGYYGFNYNQGNNSLGVDGQSFSLDGTNTTSTASFTSSDGSTSSGGSTNQDQKPIPGHDQQFFWQDDEENHLLPTLAESFAVPQNFGPNDMAVQTNALGPAYSYAQVQVPQLQQQQPDALAGQTAEQVAQAAYGDSVRIDSALCKKLASEPAMREPTQRRADQKLNIERRSNVEALLAHMTGEVAARPCKNCHKGHGPWTQCVVYEGQMCGSCSNCWFNASGSRCTFHENNNPPMQQAFYAPQAPAGPPHALFNQPQPQASFHIPVPYIYHTPTVASRPLTPNPNVSRVQSDVHQWIDSDTLGHMVGQALGEGLGMSARARHTARVYEAAREVGMRVAEHNEWKRSTEGMADTLRIQDVLPQDFSNLQTPASLVEDELPSL